LCRDICKGGRQCLETPLAIRVTDPVTVNIQEMFVVEVGQVYLLKIYVEVKISSKNSTQAQRESTG
jgi:hypothetical protein